MAQYTIKAWSNEGPLAVADALEREAALNKALELQGQGFTHISLIDAETGEETELTEFRDFHHRLS